MQNFAAKSITGHRKYDSATNSLNKLSLLNLQQRRNIHETVFLHKALLLKNTPNINDQYQNYVSTANTRLAKLRKLNTPAHKTTMFERSPLYRTIKSWNNCPPDLPFSNLKQHKALLQKHLLYKNKISAQILTSITPVASVFSVPAISRQSISTQVAFQH